MLIPEKPLAVRRGFHIVCFGLYTLACIVWNFWAGRDQNTDQMHYHVYAALAWWQDRLPDELFAASAQGYLNPVVFLPFFSLLTSGLNGLAVGGAMAVIHSLNLWLLHGIMCALIPEKDSISRIYIPIGVLLGALAPPFLIGVGGSFADHIVSLFSLGALWIAVMPDRHHVGKPLSVRRVWWVGVLAGLAAGLKPTEAIFAVALTFGLIFSSFSRNSLKILIAMTVGGLCGVVLAAGPHAFQMWKQFGNPFFPGFNSIFKSPWFPLIDLVSSRFRPQTWLDAVVYPIRMANPYARSGLELTAVDYRPIALLITLIFLLCAVFYRRVVEKCGSVVTVRRGGGLRIFWFSFLFSLPLWLYSSGNSRYALPLMLMIGPAIILIAKQAKGVFYYFSVFVVIASLMLQSLATAIANEHRWNGRPWAKQWFQVDVPKDLRERPNYYISLQSQSESFLAMFMPRESRFVNLTGQLPLEPDGRIWREVQGLKSRLGLSWRTLFDIPALTDGGGVPVEYLDSQDSILSDYGLKANREDCAWIAVDMNNPERLHWVYGKADFIFSPRERVILSCGLISAAPLSANELKRRTAIDQRFDYWAQRCPETFSPPKAVSVHWGRSRSRTYQNSELRIVAIGAKIYARSPWSDEHALLEDGIGRVVVDKCPTFRPFSAGVQAPVDVNDVGDNMARGVTSENPLFADK